MIPKLLFLIPLLFLVSCSYIENYFPVNNTIEQPIIINSTPIIQNITMETPPERLMILTPNETNIILLKQNSILVFYDNRTVLIDSGSESEVLDVITFLNDLGINKLDYIIATTPQSKYIGGIGYLSLRMKPDMVYDNGMPSDLESYKMYKRYSNVTSIIHTEYFEDFPVKVLVPFEKGLSSALSDNSLMIEFLEPSVLYMSGCGFECENKLEFNHADILILGREGGCDATSIDFIKKVNPSIAIFGQNPCADLLNKMKILGIETYIRNKPIKITKEGVTS